MRGRWLVSGLLVGLAAAASLAQEAPRPTFESVAAMVESGRLEAAEREVRRILSQAESAAARDLLGVVLSRQGRLEEAEAEFSRAVALAPDASSPRQHLARLLLRQGRTEGAASELRAAASLGPLERDLALWLAEAELAAGDQSAAEAQLLSVAGRFESVRALMPLARLQARRGQAELAAETLRRAEEIAPNSEEVLSAKARISLAGEAPVPAVEALEPLTRMHQEVSEYHYLLGVARLQLGEMDGSVGALERSLELEPGRALTLLALGTTLTAQKRFEEARDVLRRSLRLDPESAEALAVLAEAEEGLGAIEPAAEHATQALARDDDHALALLVLGMVRMRQARYDEARDLLLEAVASEPGSAKAHYQLSLAYARLGDREASGRHLELYREAQKAIEERLIELRTRAGLGVGGMKP